MRVLITRPKADAGPFAGRLHGLGFETLIEPMLDIQPLPGAEIDLEGVQAFVATSANGVRALAAATESRALPLLAVGDGTAATARDQGFSHVSSAAGTVEDLARLACEALDPAGGALVHAAGRDVSGDLAGQLSAAGFDVRRVVLYEARAHTRLSPACRKALTGAHLDGAVFFSPRSAGTFVSLAGMAGLADRAAALQAFCLSDAVAAAAAKISWRAVHVARQPGLDAMIDLLRSVVGR